MPLHSRNPTSFTPTTASRANDEPRPFRNRAVNKRTQEYRDKVVSYIVGQGGTEQDADPLLFFAELMTDTKQDMQLRAGAADRLLKYTYGTPPKTPEDQLPPAYDDNQEAKSEQRVLMLQALRLVQQGVDINELVRGGREYIARQEAEPTLAEPTTEPQPIDGEILDD